MNKLFVPRRGSNTTYFSFGQNVIKTAFKKSLIYLVIFCLVIYPTLTTYADQISTDVDFSIPDQVVPINDQNINSVNDKNIALPNGVDLPSLVDPVVTVDNPTDAMNETNPTYDPLDPSNPADQSQSLGITGLQGSGVDGLSGPSPVKQSQPGIDAPTGSLTYSYEINVPSGRNGMTPQINLSYNSQNNREGSVFGYGWGINIPYIEKVNKHGVDKLYTENYYTSSISGEIINTGGGVYLPKIDSGEFLKYEKLPNGWKVTDKQGKKYVYGTSSQSRIDDPTDQAKIYKWMLDSVEDSNGNLINYNYSKDQGQIYPESVTYTNTSGQNGLYKIVFQKSSRADVVESYSTAFLVKTAYKISEINIQTNGNMTGKYVLSYSTGNNGLRSLLASITETKYSKNGISTAMPDTIFTYINSASTIYNADNLSVLQNIFPTTYKDSGLVTGDINGDSYTDVLQAYEWNFGYYADNKNTYIYNPKDSRFETSTSYAPPVNIMSFSDGAYSKFDRGLRVVDLNGDLKADLIKLPYSHGGAVQDRQNNNGTSWTGVPITTSNLKYYPEYTSNPWYSIFVQDLNADGLVDTIQDNNYHIGGSYYTSTSINNGSFFDKTNSTSYTSPYSRTPVFTGRNDHFMMDLNGDNLPDIVDARSTSYSCSTCTTLYYYNVYINNGYGWVLDNSYKMPNYFAYYNTNSVATFTTRMEIADFNSDGLQDIYVTGGDLYINQGKSFKTFTFSHSTNNWFASMFNYCSCANPYIMLDLDGDGDQDFIKTSNNVKSTTSSVMYNALDTPNDIISSITTSEGAVSNISYKSSAKYGDHQNNLLNPNTPMVIQTVDSVVVTDALGNAAKTSYEYAGGYYYDKPDDRKFAGFSKVTQTNPDSTKKVTYYNQGNDTDTGSGEYDDHFAKIGRVYRTDTLDANNNLVKQEMVKLEKSQIGATTAYFVYPSQTISRVFTGTNSYDTAIGYDYNTNTGNLNSKTEHGAVVSTGYQSFNDTGNDVRKTEYGYTNCSSGGCLPLQLPSGGIVRDYLNNKIAEQKIYYDNSSFGVAILGNNTKTESWISGTKYATTKKSYNVLGMPISTADARNNTTTINYDIYNLYPSGITNALSQTTNYVYDYNTGKVIRTIDANGTAAETDYDGFGRPLAQRSSSDTSYTTLINTVSYTYNDTMGAGGMVPYVQKTINYSPTLSGTSYTLTDGLGREIRSINQAGTGFVASDTVYDNMGRVYKKSLPYSLSGSPINYSGATTNSNIITTNTYDALGRITTSTNTLGTNTNIYNLNTTATIDPENHTKDIVTDAFGNITNVIERNGTSAYTTTYNWGGLGNLIGVTDALGNVRTFTYDAQGNRLSATDLHAPTDTTYGSYTYAYDANNNLLQKNTPNGDVVRYIYDALNRPTRELNNSVAQINYTYDSCTNGIGQLCSVNRTGSSTKNFIYTNRGLLSSDAIILGIKNWANVYTYDYAGNLVQIKYPDSSSVRYAYNNSGQVIQIERQDLPTGVWSNVISSITYNPLGQKEAVSYANGRTQTYNYDATRQYQLSRNALDAPAGYAYPKFIDTLYTFSPSGNLTQKTENFNLANPQTFTYNYDGLSRLTGVTKTVNAPLTGYTESYTYNALGNIINKTGAGSYIYNGTAPGVYANPHAATSVGTNDYTYDRNGNLTGWGTTPNNTALTYNYRNELTNYVRVTPPSVNNTYLYDYSGARIKTTTSAGITYNPSKYFDENGTINKRYIYMGDQLVATVNVSGPGTPTINYIHPDHLGGTQVVTDSAGSLKVQDLEYYPFGQILTNTKMSSFDEKHKYTGHEYDIDTDLNFMQARYQSGKEGRFWQQDPVTRELDNQKLQTLLTEPQRWNSYSYASNNPVKYIDPDGKEPVRKYAGTIESFVNAINNSPSKIGLYVGNSAGDYLNKAGSTEFSRDRFRPEPKETFYNKVDGRYIYTENGGWVDMSHFMFYAGRAYQYKQSGSKNPVGEAVQDGYMQEMSDRFVAKHSAYSYEDLPSDYFGADFGANHFNSESLFSLSAQINGYMSKLNPKNPIQAPNYWMMPTVDSKKSVENTNYTVKPKDLRQTISSKK